MNPPSGTSRIAITPGEPAGIGPDVCILAAQRAWDAELVAFADPQILKARANALGLPLAVSRFDPQIAPRTHQPGTLKVFPVPLREECRPGHLSIGNARYVLESLRQASEGCLRHEFQALVTGPVHKGIINDAGIAFTGHTEFLAEISGTAQVVMMLAADDFRVALATTHLPIMQVSEAITAPLLERVIVTLHHDLKMQFGISDPRIVVCGLNPHAGEGGHLGREEIETISPVVERLKGRGFQLDGPLPADTVFTPRHLDTADAVLAMYHDQGLPVLKYAGFGRAVNITLGLPFIRTSVDHGTALELAGSGKAESGSMIAALETAIEMATHRATHAH